MRRYPSKPSQGEPAKPGERLFHLGPVYDSASFHISAAHDNVISLSVQGQHTIDLAQIVAEVCHSHENWAAFNLIESGADRPHYAATVSILYGMEASFSSLNDAPHNGQSVVFGEIVDHVC